MMISFTATLISDLSSGLGPGLSILLLPQLTITSSGLVSLANQAATEQIRGEEGENITERNSEPPSR